MKEEKIWREREGIFFLILGDLEFAGEGGRLLWMLDLGKKIDVGYECYDPCYYTQIVDSRSTLPSGDLLQWPRFLPLS